MFPSIRDVRTRLARGLAVFVVVLASAAPAPAQAPSSAPRGFIWTVERDGRTNWLVGSLHVLTKDAYPLPAAMEQAFTRATTLMEEIDIDDSMSPELLAAVMSKGMLANGETLQSLLPRPAYEQLSKRLSGLGMPIEMMQTMRPWLVDVTIGQLELQKAGFDPELGIDVHYRRKADARKLTLQTLETAAEQIDFLAGLPLDVQVAQLQHTLEDGEAELKEVKAIAAAWRAGDGPAIERLLVTGMKESPAYYQSLLVDRNRRWIPRIEACFATGSCFVVVGAAHMLGGDGLVTLLRQKGYRVTQQ